MKLNANKTRTRQAYFSTPHTPLWSPRTSLLVIGGEHTVSGAFSPFPLLAQWVVLPGPADLGHFKFLHSDNKDRRAYSDAPLKGDHS